MRQETFATENECSCMTDSHAYCRSRTWFANETDMIIESVHSCAVDCAIDHGLS